MASNGTHEQPLKLIETDRMAIIDGVIYSQGNSFKDAKTHLGRIKDLELRDDDVVTLGFMRSGNHWAFEVVNMILHQTTQFKKENFAFHVLENRGEGIVEALSKETSPRQIVTHYRARALPRQVVEKKIRVIYLMRNPKDVLPSMYKLRQMFGNTVKDFSLKGTFEDFLKQSLSGDLVYGSWFDHVLDAERFMKDHPDVPVFVLCYEHMIENPEKAIKELSHFLNRPDEMADDIAKCTQIDAMRNLEKFKAPLETFFKDGKENYLVRHGGIGKWKEAMTVSQSELIDREFKEKMAGSKLGAIVQPYMS